ncbi:unnamed protein product [Nippostrongylus brasiliensis]|uniref:G protein-coupled receptor n=1 Tax=Nippostrongylus brasiliensis TaxID=27835 RepID=A0A0N4YVB8_NIPBR|nr:unnamed protein product [Nippostrongylus brasiliensis]
MFIVSSLTLVIIYRRDSGKLRDITGETGKYAINYTLSLKFQLAENVRVAKILVYFSAGLSAWGSFGCCLSASSLVIFGEAHAVGQLVYSLLNNYIALSFTILVWCLLWSIGEIRRILTIFSTMSGCCHLSLRVTPITRSIAVTEHPHQTTEKYFDQLRSAWMHTSDRRNP